MALYKYVLHHSANLVPKWFLETLGVWVSQLNRCDYSVGHHYTGLKRLLGDDGRAAEIRAALAAEAIESGPFQAKEQLALRYAEALTRDPSAVTEDMINGLREVGYDDGEILEINQVAAYFAYANRTVLGLGCDTVGDRLASAIAQFIARACPEKQLKGIAFDTKNGMMTVHFDEDDPVAVWTGDADAVAATTH